MMKTTNHLRPLWEIAEEIQREWINEHRFFAARPYLQAMLALESVEDHYGLDDGESIVLYFLSNASGWRGEAAKRIKAELNAHLSR